MASSKGTHRSQLIPWETDKMDEREFGMLKGSTALDDELDDSHADYS